MLDENLPRFRALADAIARDLKEGRLQAGDRLPTHRDLADVLGVTVGTVSRGYAEAERRGLTGGVVGRGTFIRGTTSLDPWPEPTEQGSEIIDLSLSLPVRVPGEALSLAETLNTISRDERIGVLLDYHAESAMPHQKSAAAAWLARLGLSAKADDILVTAGSQHGLNVIFSSVFLPGQVVLTGDLVYPAVKSQARSYGIRLRGVEMDEQGVCPDAVERACRIEPRPSGLYVDPTLQNPTSAIQSEVRRQKLAQIAETYNLWIIEDDVHAFLLPEPPLPLATYAPARTVYLSSVAKCLVPGLRTGFAIAPSVLRARLLTGIHNTIWMPPPLMVEVTTRWLADGTADRLIAAKRREVAIRQEMVRDILAHHTPRGHPYGYQVWIELPEPWCTDGFVAEARERGVKVIGSSAFAVNRSKIPHAFRLSIGVPSRSSLAQGLRTVNDILSGGGMATY